MTRLDEIKLVPIVHRAHLHVMAYAFKWFFGFGWQFPFVVMSRKTLDNWTFNACDQAVFQTAQVFRGKILP